MMQDNIESLVLYTINQKLPAESLLERGLSYSQVSDIMSSLQKKALLRFSDGELIITAEGKELLKRFSQSHKYEKLSFIQIDKSYLIPTIDINAIYLPAEAGDLTEDEG
jgi:predicted transcriptional regulator